MSNYNKKNYQHNDNLLEMLLMVFQATVWSDTGRNRTSNDHTEQQKPSHET